MNSIRAFFRGLFDNFNPRHEEIRPRETGKIRPAKKKSKPRKKTVKKTKRK